jgi:hypothetical protein
MNLVSPSTKPTAEYLVLQAALPSAKIENIGVLLLDAKSDRLYSRYRRDFEVFAGEEADVLALLN